MPVDYFLVNVRTQASDKLKQPEGTYELFYEDYFYKSVLVNGFTNSIISLDNVISNLSNPFVKSFLFLWRASASWKLHTALFRRPMPPAYMTRCNFCG